MLISVTFLISRNCSLHTGVIFLADVDSVVRIFFCVFVSYSYFVLYFFVMFSFGRLLVLNFSLVVPATFDPLLHICICFPSKINDDDDDVYLGRMSHQAL